MTETETLTPVISSEQIYTRATVIGQKVVDYWRGSSFVTIGILNGCIPWFTCVRGGCAAAGYDEAIDYDFYTAKSYRGEYCRSELIMDAIPDLPLAGKNVLLLDDIADSGITLNAVVRHIYQQQPAELLISVLLDKPSGRTEPLVQPVAFPGFEVDAGFYVGFGMDYNYEHRGLREVYTLETTSP